MDARFTAKLNKGYYRKHKPDVNDIPHSNLKTQKPIRSHTLLAYYSLS